MHLSDTARITPIYATLPVTLDDEQLHARFERALEAKRLTRTRTDQAHNSKELWRSGAYDLQTLPYLLAKYGDHRNGGPNSPSAARCLRSTESPARHLPRRRRGDMRAESMVTLEGFQFEKCVSCAGIFEYRLDDASTVQIFSGLPGTEVYTAISYVWGSTSDVAARCASCDYITVFPMHSISKFSDMMHMVGAGNVAWLDALSIDQADPADQARQIPAMGNIYNVAARVSVLLPADDSRAYQLLATLTSIAKQILDRPAHFIFNYEDAYAENAELTKDAGSHEGRQDFPDAESFYRPTYGTRATSELCTEFVTCLQTFEAVVEGSVYWSRAWTFQEWAMALDVDMGLELSPVDAQNASSRHRCFTSVKSSIFSAASLISQYVSLEGPYAKAHFGLSRGPIAVFFDMVKRLFPLEAQMLAPDEIDTREYLLQSQLPSTGCYQLLGLRADPRVDELAGRRARLHIMLNAFATSERHAKFDADLIACWAGMCGVQYQYVKDDGLLIAVCKVKSALRASGFKIFDFVPEGLEWNDRKMLSFFYLAQTHRMCNAKQGAVFSGLPILTGRCDAGAHLAIVLAQDLRKMSTLKSSEHLRHVLGSVISSAPLSEIAKATDILLDSTHHESNDSIMFSTLRQPFLTYLKSLPNPLVGLYKVVQVSIPVSGPYGERRILVTWGLCAKTVPDSDLTVGRDDIDGAVVLLMRDGSQCYVIAYLVFTDSMSGSLAVHSDEQGAVELLLDTPKRSDMTVGLGGGACLTDDRYLRCNLEFGGYL